MQPDSGQSDRSAPVARSMGDEALVEAITSPGCPLCRHVARIGPQYLDSLLYQHTTDRTYRDRFVKGGGFCPRHVRAALAADAAGNGDGVGGSIFLRSMLAARRRSLEAAGGVRASRRIRAATQPAWDCPACENERTLAEAAARRLVAHAASDETWRTWVAGAAWCLAHLGDVLVAARGDGQALTELRSRQLQLMHGLEDRLDTLAHDSSHGRRDRLTPEVRAALAEVVELLAGNL